MNHKSEQTKPLLMLVDDDAPSRMILKHIFAGKYETVEAVNGKLALDLINRGIKPDLVILDLNMPEIDGYDVLDELHQSDEFKHIPIIIATADGDYAARRKAFFLGAIDVITKPFMPESIMYRVDNILTSITATKAITESIILDEILHPGALDVSGIWGRQRFIDEVSRFLAENPNGKYVLARWDIDHFKLFNDNFGIAEGDRLLRSIGIRYTVSAERMATDAPLFYAHWGADHFVELYERSKFNPDKLYSYTLMQLNSCFEDFDFSISYGFFDIDDPTLSVSVMCDRAGLALSSIKNQYDKHYEWYTGEMRDRIVEELEITSSMKRALEKGEFIPFFQPQYNYETGELIGAESLVRWNDPQKGIIAPGAFIPLFEKNGFISEVDFYMWNVTCAYIREWLDKGYNVPPISVNISRRDFYDSELVSKMCSVVEKYNIAPELLHLEMTESAYMDNPDQLLMTLAKLKEKGFHVEMDDFGSGYSSLNTLKDVPVDLLKLDMKFVSESANNARGGSILSSVIHMAHGINLPVLAEGIETRQQADYLKTINCIYMQGYLFSKPIPAEEFEKLIAERGKSTSQNSIIPKTVDNSVDFLDASTQATLLFNSFLGGAAIIEYENKNILILRSNDRFYDELRLPRSDFDNSNGSFMQYIEAKSRKSLINAVELAIETGEETSCNVHFTAVFHDGREEWLHARFRSLAGKFHSHILYVSISNVTVETLLDRALKKERIALENILHFAPGGLAEFVANDSHLTRIYTSETAQDILEITSGEATEENFFAQLKQIHPEDRGTVKRVVKECVDKESPFSVEFRISLPRGGVRWVNLSANPARIDNELHYFGIYTDISRHKAIEIRERTNIGENALGETTSESLVKRSLHKYLSTTTDLVYIKDTNMNFLACSENFARFTGHSSYAEIIGKTDFDVFPDEERASRTAKLDLDAIASGQDKVDYIENITDSRTDRQYILRTSRYILRDSEGVVVGMFATACDITDQHVFDEYKISLASSGRSIYRYIVNKRLFIDEEKGTNGEVTPISIKNGPEYVVSSGQVAPDSIGKWMNLFDRIDSGERSGTEDLRFREENGSYNWYRVNFKSIFDKKGKPSSAIITYRNVEHYHSSDMDKEIMQSCIYSALVTLYPAFAISNLTENVTRPIVPVEGGMPGVEKPGSYDEAVKLLASRCVTNAGVISSTFNRSNLIKSFASGKALVSAFADVKYADGSVHAVECVAIHVTETVNKEVVYAVGLMREV
ncbi:MAG: EAL domain-containing protein [Lachnospiraceae bacterium]|nr:EAL domain-containing protein [Lachnospiraceae bacterium]